MKSLGTFYVLDFDRCLGNVDASFGLLKDIVKDVLKINGAEIQLAYEKAEITGVSFSVLDYVKDNYPKANLDIIKKSYFKRAKLIKNSLLEPGAVEFLNFLRSSERDFCIMSYGEKSWQKLKIISTGIDDGPILIVSSHKKGSLIANWYDAPSRKYHIPKECFLDNKPRTANEIVLIDDKIGAFDNLPDNARGYLVAGLTNRAKLVRQVPSRFKQVVHVDEIIAFEIQHFTK